MPVLLHFLPVAVAVAVSLLTLASQVPSAAAHPSYLECSGLSARLAAGSSIMGFTPKKVADLEDAPVMLQRHKPPAHSSPGSLYPALQQQQQQQQEELAWTNFTFAGLSSGTEFAIEVLQPAHGPGQQHHHNNITCFGHGICGSNPKFPGRGLCQKCPAQLFAEDYDCTDGMKCTFGVASSRQADSAALNVSILIAWGQGDSISYVHVDLDSI
eukprot:INCI2494.1.p1 GENE.INCI2494.1~~INCI2494.1.p1  ORF type:complete len:213 (+),score=41.08 INCI2494.1:106-744(+)